MNSTIINSKLSRYLIQVWMYCSNTYTLSKPGVFCRTLAMRFRVSLYCGRVSTICRSLMTVSDATCTSRCCLTTTTTTTSARVVCLQTSRSREQNKQRKMRHLVSWMVPSLCTKNSELNQCEYNAEYNRNGAKDFGKV